MKKQSSIILKKPSKGYVFKLKRLLKAEDAKKLLDQLTKQLYD